MKIRRAVNINRLGEGDQCPSLSVRKKEKSMKLNKEKKDAVEEVETTLTLIKLLSEQIKEALEKGNLKRAMLKLRSIESYTRGDACYLADILINQ